ncbi:hypothetical protein R1flu_004898 [Riccia fluitans]|uniref:Bulb-type lectin domain-containing protein n=1 Tax=Riccia fluitans TaxID=41844 RepID=A0ABD1YSL0_9MARC
MAATVSALLVCFSLMAIASMVQADRAVLIQPYKLNSGESLWQGSYEFRMQQDCNLVLYKNGNPIWASNTGGKSSNCYFTLQEDGNGVVYDGNYRAIWATGTNGVGPSYIILQCDGNVVLYTPDARPIWATGTNGRKEIINLEEDSRMEKPSNDFLISEVVRAANV